MSPSDYSTVAEVREYTGVRPNWLNKADDAALEETLDRWIVEAQGLVEEACNDSWTDADVPDTVRSVTKRVVANMILAARRHREDQVRRVDDITNERSDPVTPATRVLTSPLIEELSPYIRPRKGRQAFRLMRVRRKEEMNGAV